MSVYVNSLRQRRNTTIAWPYLNYCHMTADSKEELFEIALKLRLHWEWFHQTKKKFYFPLNTGRRQAAIELGAIECDDRRKRVR
jgi:hypothetical protein